jgi:serine/threonine-protein kinase
MVQEFVPGETLQDRLQRLDETGRVLSIEEAIRYTLDLCDALAYAHQRGIIHRHLQPKNIILSDSRVKIMNFGLADPPSDKWTQTDIAYMPPEQLTGREPGANSDLYALGVFLYEMLTRQLPFQADSTEAMIAQCTSAPPRPPSELNPCIPPQMEDLLLALLAKDPRNRPQTVGKVMQRLEKSWSQFKSPNHKTVKQIA